LTQDSIVKRSLDENYIELFICYTLAVLKAFSYLKKIILYQDLLLIQPFE